MPKARILIVEDEAIVAKDIGMNLKDFGYEVTSIVSSGEEAIEKASIDKPDLVLMDIVLQGKVDGISAAEEISKLKIPVVYLTAHADQATLERAKISEPFGYILKPFECRELHCNIEIALSKHKLESKLKEELNVVERLNKQMIHRELEMEKLKKEIESLKKKLSSLEKESAKN
ncbi:MAG: response regulator [Deltaproteobacteria bacterium]|nr:response regulator [Deltaproteobacteria bacterium]